MTDPKPPRKRRSSRDSESGKSVAPDLTADQKMMGQVVLWVNAITTLEPLFVTLALEEESPESAKAYAVVGATLSVLKQSFVQQMAVDAESQKDAKKLRLDVERLGCLPMAEQAKVMHVVDRWMELPSLPRVASIGTSTAKPAIEADPKGGTH